MAVKLHNFNFIVKNILILQKVKCTSSLLMIFASKQVICLARDKF